MLVPESRPANPAERRSRAARLTLGGSAAAKVFAMLCTFAQVPIVLGHLGPEGFGLWATLMGGFGMLHFLDLGLGTGMQREMAEAFGRDDPVRVRRAFRSGLVALAALGAGIGALVALAALAGPWSAWLRLVDDALRADVGQAGAVIGAAFALSLPSGAVAHAAAAVQRHWWHSAWNAAGNGLTLGCVAAAAWADWDFLPFVALTATLPIVQNLGLGWQLRSELFQSAAGPRLLESAAFGRMVRTSLVFSIPQSVQAALGWLPVLAVLLASGAQAVTAFNLLQRLLSPVTHGHGVLLAPVWPLYAEARVRGDSAWLRRARRASLAATGGAVAGIVVLAAAADKLLVLWVGDGAPAVAPTLAAAVVAWAGLNVVSRHYHYYLLGMDRLADLARWSAVGLGGTLVGLAAGAALGGPAATVGCGALGFILTGLPGLAFAAHRKESGGAESVPPPAEAAAGGRPTTE